MLHRGVKHRSKQKSDAYLANRARGILRSECDVDPEFLQQIGTTALRGHRSVAVLGHAYSRAGSDKSGDGRDIEGSSAIATCAAGIEQRQGIDASIHIGGLFAHGARKTEKLLRRLALGP